MTIHDGPSSNLPGVIYIPNFVNGDPKIYLTLLLQLPFIYESFLKREVCHYRGGSDELDTIIELIEREFGKIVSGVFANHYRDGNDYAPYHKDQYDCTVASLSLGVSRDFYFQHVSTKDRYRFLLKSGDLLVFKNSVNKKYKHSVPVRKKVKDGRICLTFFLQ